jgi:hypothetical protein
MTRPRHVLVTGFVSAAVLLVLWVADAGSSSSSRCVLCRLERNETTLFGLTRARYAENDCSKWYRAHVESEHEHLWERGTCTAILNGLGVANAVRCRAGHFPILGLATSTQMRVYQHFGDLEKAKALFTGLTHERMGSEILDGNSKGDWIVHSLEDWESAGFPGNWDVWWNRWWQNHQRECAERPASLQSDSAMNVSVWQKLKNAARTARK